MEEVEERVLCVDLFADHLPESVLVYCCECRKKLWCSPHHVHEGRKAICIDCIPKKNIEIGIHPVDFIKAMCEIIKKRKNVDERNKKR